MVEEAVEEAVVVVVVVVATCVLMYWHVNGFGVWSSMGCDV